MPQFWEQDAVVSPQKKATPQPVISLPNPQQDKENARADAALGNSTTQTNIAVRDEQRDIDKTAFQQTMDLRKAYEAAPEVKNYRAVVPQLMDALKAPDDASGDNALLYAYAKIMDPASVVRESETEGAAAGASIFDQTVANLKKQLGIEGGGQLSPEIRAGLKRQALARVQQYGTIYRAQRQRYAGDADAFGIDPARVIGPDDFDPYLPQFNEYMKRQQGQAQPPMGGGGFGGSTPENPFPGMFDQNGRPLGPEGGMAYDKDGNELGLVGSVTDTTDVDAYNKRLDDELARRGFDPNSPLSYIDRASQGALLGFADEIYGLQGGAEALFGNRGVGDGYTFNRDLWRRGEERQREAQGWLGTAAELGGGLVTGFGGGTAKGVAGLARQGAIQGAVAGYGYGEGLGGSLAGAAGGAVLGAGTGALLGKGGEYLTNRRLGPAVTNRLYNERILGPEYQPGDVLPQYGYRNVSNADEVQAIIDKGYMLPPEGRTGKYFTMSDRQVPTEGNATAGKPILRVRSENIPNGRAVKSRDVEVWDNDAGVWRPLIPRNPTAAQNYASGQKFGIDLSLGDAGGMSPKIVERILDVQPGAGSVMNAERNRLAGQIEGAVGDVAGSFGQRTSFAGMGETAQTGARNWMDKFQRVATKVYDAIPIKPKVEATADNTRAALSEITKGFESNPELSKLWTGFPQLRATLDALTPTDVSGIGAQELPAATQRLSQAEARYANTLNNVTGAGEQVAARQEVEAARRAVDEATQKAYAPPQGGQVSWEDMKRLRSIVGQIIGKPSLNSDGATDKAMRGFYEALSRDMEATAASQGPAALKAFQRANSIYREGQARIDGALTRLLGKRDDLTPEKAASVIQAIAKDGKSSSDLATLADIRKSLKPDEWGQVSSGFIELLGHPANAAGREFSPNTFITNFKNMAPEAKNLLFGGENKALRQNLDEFVKVMDLAAKNNATRNTSNTAMGLAGLIGYGAGGAGTLLAQAATSFGAAKLWTHPAFVRWATGFTKMEAAAARSGQINQSALQSQMSALSRIAANDNVIAADVAGLQQVLMERLFPQTRAAASPPIAAPRPSSNEEKRRTQGEGQ